MKKFIGLTDGFDWSRPPTKAQNMYSFFNQIQEQNPDLAFLSIDWRSIDSEGLAKGFNFRNPEPVTFNVGDLDLFHLLYLGTTAHEWDNLISKVETVDSLCANVVNPLETIKYAVNKSYLLDLQEALPVIPTRGISSRVSLEELKDISAGKYDVAKPLNGEKGLLVRKIDDLTSEDLINYSSQTDTILLQPFMQGINEGEKHLIYLGDRFSHAVVKKPISGEFKVNASANGVAIPYSPTQEEISLGFEVKNKFKHPLDIYRVDIVSSDNGPKVMEIEAVNPSHHTVDNSHAQRLGQFYRNYFRRFRK